jgi:hypothetical protein
LLAGGAAITALALFVVLVGAALRRDQLAELERLRNAGARAGQTAMFVAAESAWVALGGLLAGAVLGFAAAAVLARTGGEPVGGVLMHGVIIWETAAALAAGWVAATALLASPVLLRSPRVGDALALAAVAALAVALVVNPGSGDAPAVLVAPLCCLAAGLLVFRGASWALVAGERAVRRGPPLVRLALVGLAREPGLPSLAIAFVAVSLGLGGFALAYRATLQRGAADEAADRVPLDALVVAGPSFTTPLTMAPLARWRALAGGAVLPVRRTEADYLRGSGTVTIPALGVPAAALERIHGWRSSDGSAPLLVLARRLRPTGPVRNPGPSLSGARSLSVRASSPTLPVSVTADLRAPEGAVRQLALGVAPRRPSFLHAQLPQGRWELEALELDEPTALEITNGHQNGENVAAATQQRVRLTIGPLLISSGAGRRPIEVGTGSWLAAGAASSSARSQGATAAIVSFETSGAPGIVRPAQPSDTRAVPVLADPQTAAAAGAGGRLALTVDGLPVRARVAGAVRRFPTLEPAAGGVVVADEATLSSALEAQLPGQGRPDELWISTPRPSSLRSALSRMPLAQLSSTFRPELEHRLSSAPIARGVQRTLLAAAVLWAAVAALGLVTALIGPGRDRLIERDLEAQGMGPRALRLEARARVAVAGALGVAAGIVIALVLTRLAVASVRAGTTVGPPRPPLVTVVPVAQLGAWVAIVVAVLASAGLLATRRIGAARSRRPTPSLTGRESELTEGVAR